MGNEVTKLKRQLEERLDYLAKLRKGLEDPQAYVESEVAAVKAEIGPLKAQFEIALSRAAAQHVDDPLIDTGR
jgi:hypothetical protein